MSTNCEDIRGDLVAYVDGELGEARHSEVQVHLEACGDCQAERTALVRSFESLDLLEGIAPRAGWLKDVERSILDPAAAPAGKVVRFPAKTIGIIVALAASIALAAGLVWLANSGQVEDDPIADKRPSPNAPKTPDAPQERELPPRDIDIDDPDVDDVPDAPDRPIVDRQPDPAPPPQRLPERREPELALNLDELTDEELDYLENPELANLPPLDEIDVLDVLDDLDDLDPEERDTDET